LLMDKKSLTLPEMNKATCGFLISERARDWLWKVYR
jgi:hypothetical protein